MKIKTTILALVTLAMASCSTTRDNHLTYFNNLPGNDGTVPLASNEYAIKLQPDDELLITISSSVPAATAIYNAPASNSQSRNQLSLSAEPKQQTYIVDPSGNIELPVIGRMNVKGMTTNQLAETLRQRVARDVKDPYVTVKLVGFYVNVMGEVKEPSRVKVNGERLTLLEALAAAGDLTEYAERNNVLVLREENGATAYHRLDLSDSRTLSSPYFYLQQNDVVYVSPNTIREDNSKYNTNNAYKLSLTSTIVSAASVIASLIIALVVK
ncbi:MAG: polysaccharide biosynthesis/export family protein [Muribaculaceae bacterium]|nr:polysaccharide biosynthesis/export family protein [Muribaculaceae bacterium]